MKESMPPVVRPAVAAMTLATLARRLDAPFEGDPELLLTGAAGLEDARPGDLVRVDGARWLSLAEASPAAALLVPTDLRGVTRPAVRVVHPRLAFARALALLYPSPPTAPGIHPTATVADDAQIGEGCAIMAGAIIGSRVRLGHRVVVHPRVVIGDEVTIGDECVLFPNVTLYSRVSLGRRVQLHAGVVVGSDGFGYVPAAEGPVKVPHVGTVLIEDDVEVGANSAIDRATTGLTRIGAGTKIDNLVQIGHNCQIGRHCFLAGHVALAGSVTLEDGVTLGGAVGVGDHARLVSGVTVAGYSGVWRDLRAAGLYSGSPAREHRRQLLVLAALQRLPDLARAVADLVRRVAQLETRP